MENKLLLSSLMVSPTANFRKSVRHSGKGWVDSGDARVWTQRAVLPSILCRVLCAIHHGRCTGRAWLHGQMAMSFGSRQGVLCPEPTRPRAA